MPIAMQILTLPEIDGEGTTVLYRPSFSEKISSLVLFFPGDISDFAFSGLSDPLVVGTGLETNYEFSLESIAWHLSSSIGVDEALLIFRPSRVVGSYSIYSNLLTCDVTGNPVWADLTSTLSSKNASKSMLRILKLLRSEIEGFSATNIKVIGFSKGCTVISAFLKEREPSLLRLIHSIKLVDPGSQFPRLLFPFCDDDYSVFPSGIKITVVCSPYQYSDPNRKWLRREIDEFVCKVACEFRYYNLLENSLGGHFSIIPIALVDDPYNLSNL